MGLLKKINKLIINENFTQILRHSTWQELSKIQMVTVVLKDIQVLVNKNQVLIDTLIKSAYTELANEDIIWTSPLVNDDYAEYRDKDFLKKVGLDPNIIQLDNFWPTQGPQWDSLAHTTGGKIILVEAKANIPEIVSQATGAGIISKTLIDKSLNETKEFLNINNEIELVR